MNILENIYCNDIFIDINVSPSTTVYLLYCVLWNNISSLNVPMYDKNINPCVKVILLFIILFSKIYYSTRRKRAISDRFSSISALKWLYFETLLTVSPLTIKLFKSSSRRITSVGGFEKKEGDEFVRGGVLETLNCQTTGSRPPPLVTWWKDGLKMRDSALQVRED